MLKKMKPAMILFFLTLAAFAGNTEEQIRNGSFEGNYSTSGLAPEWADNSSWAKVSVEYAEEKKDPYEGLSCQKMVCTSFSSGAAHLKSSSPFHLQKGKTYRLSIQLRSPDALKVDLRVMKASKPYTIYVGKVVSTESKWKEFVIEETVDENVADAIFIVRFTKTGTLFIDSASFREIGDSGVKEQVWTPPSGPIPETLFGLHYQMFRPAQEGKLPEVPFKTIRLMDSSVAWPNLEPKKGEWNFKKLDEYVRLAEPRGIDLILMLAFSPTWASSRPDEPSAYNKNPAHPDKGWAAEPRDIEDWKNYVRTVAERYRGKIRYYEIWNEVNQGGFYTGSQEKLIELHRVAYETLKAVDPQNRVIGSSCVGSVTVFDELYQKGLGKWVDIVGFHFYTFGAPEKMARRVREVRTSLKERGVDKPVWNTEAGWWIASSKSKVETQQVLGNEGNEIFSEEASGDFIARYFLTAWGFGLERFCFYSWDHGSMGMIEKDGTPKSCVADWKKAAAWMIGCTMKSLVREPSGNWVASMTDASGGAFWIAWNAEGEGALKPAVLGNGLLAVDLRGKAVLPNTSGEIPVSGTPVLLKKP